MAITLLPLNKDVRQYFGLSSDVKPTVLPPEMVGATFNEIDTGRFYIFNGTAWSRQILPTVGIGPMYYIQIASQVHVAAASQVHWDLFNAHASLVMRVLSILQIPDLTAVTGVPFAWLLERTTSVGTGGVVQTGWAADLSAPAIDATITCRSKPTGGAAQGADLFSFVVSSEETDAGIIAIASRPGLELVPQALRPEAGGAGIVVRPNTGLRHNQNTNSAAGNTGWMIGFTLE